MPHGIRIVRDDIEPGVPRPPLNSGDRFFWTTLRRFWSRWTEVLLIVRPETVVGWHRAGFRPYWRRSPSRGGRPRVTQELRDLIVRLAGENPNWAAPKIHGERQKLGFTIAERTVARYLSSIHPVWDVAELYSAHTSTA